MARNQAMGHDPLDWVGKGGPADAGSSGCSERVRVENSRANDESTRIESFSTAEIVDSFPERAARTGESSSVPVPVPDDRTSLALERKLLLLDEYDGRSRWRHGSRRSSKSNQLLLLLIFLFSFVGTALFFYNETQRRWREQVRTLQAHVLTLERDQAQAVRLVSSALESKDQIIAEKEKTIASLEASRLPPRQGLERAWRRFREIGDQFRGLLPGSSRTTAED